MKKLLLVFGLLLIGSVAWADTLTINTTSAWNSYINSKSDLVVESNKLIFRHEDVPADFSLHADHNLDGGTNATVTDDLPADETYLTSRHITLGTDTYAQQVISWGNQAIIQPNEISWYVKAPDHDSSQPPDYPNDEYYVFCFGNQLNPGGFNSSLSAVNADYTMYIGSVQYDSHTPYNHVLSSFTSQHDDTSGTGEFISKSAWSYTTNTWHKYTQTFDWTNKTYTVATDDTPIADWTRYSLYGSSLGTISDGNIGMAIYGPWKAGGSILPTTSLCSYPFTSFNTWYERYGYTITSRMDYHISSSFCKYALQSGTAYLVYSLSDLSASITSAALSWGKVTNTDSNVTPLYSRNYLTESGSCSATAGTAANALTPTSGALTYWAAATGSSWSYDCGTPRTFSYFEFTASLDGSDNILAGDFTIYGSTDNSNWDTIASSTTTTINYSGSFSNSTAYRYWKITFTSSAGASLSIGAIVLREAAAAKTAANWVGYKVETGVNTSSSSYTGITWDEKSEYEAITEAEGSTTGKYLWVKITLSTDLQAYHPEMPSLSLCYNGDSCTTAPGPAEAHGVTLGGGVDW